MSIAMLVSCIVVGAMLGLTIYGAMARLTFQLIEPHVEGLEGLGAAFWPVVLPIVVGAELQRWLCNRRFRKSIPDEPPKSEGVYR